MRSPRHSKTQCEHDWTASGSDGADRKTTMMKDMKQKLRVKQASQQPKTVHGNSARLSAPVDFRKICCNRKVKLALSSNGVDLKPESL